MTLRRALALGVATASAQQPAAAKKSFEVTSVKPAAPLDPQKLLSGQQRIGMKQDAGRVDIEGWSILELLNAAYKATPARITGPARKLEVGLRSKRVIASMLGDLAEEQLIERRLVQILRILGLGERR